MRELISTNPGIQGFYNRMRDAGESHNIAELLAFRAFQGVRGLDSDFNKGRVNGNQFEAVPDLGNYYRRIAEEAGVNTTGKTYMRGLAEFPGDPAAWVSDTNNVLRVAREKGFNVHGAVEYEAQDRREAPPEEVPVAPETVEAQVEEYMTNDPSGRREDVREQ